jgi:hypothetical protein
VRQLAEQDHAEEDQTDDEHPEDDVPASVAASNSISRRL